MRGTAQRRLIFVSNTCSSSEFSYLQSIKHSEKLNPSQKYFSMLLDGLSSNRQYIVECVTARSIDPSNCSIIRLEKKEEVVDGIKYYYTSVKNKKIYKTINNYIQGKKTIKRIIDVCDTDCVLLVNPLSFDISSAAVSIAKKKKIKCIAIVTDVPLYLEKIQKTGEKKLLGRIKSSLRQHMTERMFNSFDGFCFLTQSMNIINRNGVPYTIIEGMVPYQAETEIHENSVSRNDVVYAGGLFPQFGIDNLVNAAKQVNIADFRLLLYGEGSSIAFINDTSDNYPNIKYMGTVGLDEIAEIEKKAKVLINPRPSDEEFTLYSFPSKTLEYMTSGRPVLSTRLGGIPAEYNDFIIWIESETVEGIRDAITGILEKSEKELNIIGQKAFQFVMEEKNNKLQARKLEKLINTVCRWE